MDFASRARQINMVLSFDTTHPDNAAEHDASTQDAANNRVVIIFVERNYDEQQKEKATEENEHRAAKLRRRVCHFDRCNVPQRIGCPSNDYPCCGDCHNIVGINFLFLWLNRQQRRHGTLLWRATMRAGHGFGADGLSTFPALD